MFYMFQAKCLENCPCDEPKNWRSHSISLTRLEEVEIYKFKGGDHEIDLVTMILSWAPMLTRMTIRLTHEINPSDIGDCAKSIYIICFCHPPLNSFIYLSTGKLAQCSEVQGDPEKWL